MKVSNLLSCYQDLAIGVPLEMLYKKYVRIEVIIALELFEKGVTLRQLEEFVRRRNEHIEAMLSSPLKKVVTFSKRLERKC